MNCCKILHLLPFTDFEHGMFAAVAEFRPPSVHYHRSLFIHQAITAIRFVKRGFRMSLASATLGVTQEQPQQLQLTRSLWAPSNHQSIAIIQAIIKSFPWYYLIFLFCLWCFGSSELCCRFMSISHSEDASMWFSKQNVNCLWSSLAFDVVAVFLWSSASF